jgi:aldehyde:ferredoxin oxidoreductase
MKPTLDRRILLSKATTSIRISMKAGRSYCGKILRVDLSKKEVNEEPIKAEWVQKFIGGKGLGIRYLYELVPPGTDPFSRENAVIFMTGPLTGTIMSTMSRMANVTRSPLTGTMSDSYSGGYLPAELKFAGFDGVVVTGRAPKPVYLSIKDGQAELRDASHLWGKGVFETTDLVVRESGESPRRYIDGPKVGCIGPAGENGVRYAAVAYDKHHFAGRGGTGAVMGSKNFKAICVRGTKQAKALGINSEPAYLEMVKEIVRKDIRENPDETSYIKEGTPSVVDLSQGAGLLPTRDFQTGVFPEADQINTSSMFEKILVKHTTTCFSCAIGCRNLTKVRDGQFAGLEGEGPEYETLAMCGSNLGIGDIRAIMKFNEECSDWGLDTISAGCVCGWAMELFERGIITKKDTDGMELRFGNVEVAITLPRLISLRKGIGDTLAEGIARASNRIGRNSERYAMHVKGQEYPAYDPRGTFGMALAYATSDRGADHNRAWPVGNDAFGQLDPFTIDGKAELVKNDQVRSSLKWSTTMCDFLAANFHLIARLVNAACDTDYSEDDIKVVGERIWNLARLFNLREGFSRKDDSIPPRVYLDPLPEGNPKGKVLPQEDFQKMLSEYYRLFGWDDQGRPTRDTLHRLALEDLA